MWTPTWWFRYSGGPVDPRECIWFVERVLSRIDDVSPCLWAAFLLMWGYLVGHLILVRSCAFCLELRSVFPCSWSVFSPLFHLHTNIYQHSWKWSVINPYHYVDVYILCIYAGVDGLNLVLKSHQQLACFCFVGLIFLLFQILRLRISPRIHQMPPMLTRLCRKHYKRKLTSRLRGQLL